MKQQSASPLSRANPILSLILCSRNDQYMGNSLWRLQTALNYVAQNVYELGRQQEVEILVTDWGSDRPLHTALQLSEEASHLVSFIVVPPPVARALQRDSSFSEVHALNAAVRRSKGKYIGRIDQDTLVGKRFLRKFFRLHEGVETLETPLNTAVFFANRRSIPFRFASLCPEFPYVDRFIRAFAWLLKVWSYNPHTRVFWTSYVGIIILHRDLWMRCGGYDERLIYYDWMEVDLIVRLKARHPIVDLGKLVNYDFYHLDHYHLRPTWNAILHPRAKSAKSNPYILNLEEPPAVVHPNGDDWGMVNLELPIVREPPVEEKRKQGVGAERGFSALTFVYLVLLMAARSAHDRVNMCLFWCLGPSVRAGGDFYVKWRHRGKVAWDTIRGHSVFRWPGLLINLWIEKKTQ